jgi:hypothetical protein
VSVTCEFGYGVSASGVLQVISQALSLRSIDKNIMPYDHEVLGFDESTCGITGYRSHTRHETSEVSACLFCFVCIRAAYNEGLTIAKAHISNAAAQLFM